MNTLKISFISLLIAIPSISLAGGEAVIQLTKFSQIPNKVKDISTVIGQIKPKIQCFNAGGANKQQCAGDILALFVKMIKPIVDSLVGEKSIDPVTNQDQFRDALLPYVLRQVQPKLSAAMQPKAGEFLNKMREFGVRAQDGLSYILGLATLFGFTPTEAEKKDLPPAPQVPPVKLEEKPIEFDF